MDYPDVTSWRPGEPDRPKEPHPPRREAASGAVVGNDLPPPGPVAVDPGHRPPEGGPLPFGGRPVEDFAAVEDFADIPPAKPRSFTPARLLTIGILIALAFLGGVYVQKQAVYGYTPPVDAPKEFVPHGH
ncbi:MAG: hypothetical protein ACT4QF_02700 [Sporichthyaceae bacterium]